MKEGNTDFKNHTRAKMQYINSKYALLFLENKGNDLFIRACESVGIIEQTRNRIENMTYNMDLATTVKIEAITNCKFFEVAKKEELTQ